VELLPAQGRRPADPALQLPSTAAQIHAEILSAAVRLNVPLKAEDLLVRRQNGRTTASGSYKQSVEFFPNYLYPLSFSFVVDAVSLGGAPGDDEPRRVETNKPLC